MGLSFEKIVLLVLIVAVVLGPERLPQYAAWLGRAVRSLRRTADTAQGRLRDELGDEYEQIDWRRLDPRQYDPRRIIAEALQDPAHAGAAPAGPAGTAPAGTRAGSVGSAGAPDVPALIAAAAAARRRRLATGALAPFDDDAT